MVNTNCPAMENQLTTPPHSRTINRNAVASLFKVEFFSPHPFCGWPTITVTAVIRTKLEDVLNEDRLSKFEAWLKTHGRRFTATSKVIASITFNTPEPINPNDILNSAAKIETVPRISHAAVFRTVYHIQLSGLAIVEHDFTGRTK